MSVGPPRRRMVHDDAWLYSPFQVSTGSKVGNSMPTFENMPQNMAYMYLEPTRPDDWLTSNTQLTKPKKARRRS